MASKKLVVWYMSRDVDRRGVHQMTDRVEEAITVKKGDQELPIVAGFYASSYGVQQYKRRLKIWAHLLDLMEQEQDLEEETNHADFNSVAMIVRHRERMRGVMEALAMLSYGNVSQDALALIQRQADARYEQES